MGREAADEHRPTALGPAAARLRNGPPFYPLAGQAPPADVVQHEVVSART
jgi:hypothetical protein